MIRKLAVSGDCGKLEGRVRASGMRLWASSGRKDFCRVLTRVDTVMTNGIRLASPRA